MSRDYLASPGSRPAAHSPARPSHDANNASSLVSGPPLGGHLSNAPMLSASSSKNHHPLFSYGQDAESGSPARNNDSYDFLPSVSFDDLQSSIESASTEFKLTQFPSPAGGGSILDPHGMGERAGSVSQAAPNPAASRPGRSGSILRRPSTSGRLTGATSNAPPVSGGFIDAPTAPAAMRNRRQSHYPPVSTNNNTAKPPRKSIGPGVVGDMEVRTQRTASQRRRPSLMADRNTGDTTRVSIDSSSGAGSDNTRNFTNPRPAKAKSVLPPPHPSQANLMPGSTLTPEQNRLSTLAPKSPRAGGSGRGTTPSSNNRRASVMPGSHQASHATGLGARTISPTDARRMRRLSTMPQSQSLNQIVNVPPPPPVSMDNRADSRSPSMIPRRTSVTPSSARATPDHPRRQLATGSSGNSLLIFANGNTSARNATALPQPRGIPQSASTSRLPAPKASNSHAPMSAEDGEYVPPVPAIPKAYESPKDSPSDAYFMEKKRTGLSGLDSTSVHSSSTGSISMPVLPEPTKIQRRPSARKSSFVPVSNAEAEKKASQSRRNLQPLSLPPLNLGPLSIPTAAKVAALQDLNKVSRPLSPPTTRQPPKTPTTPMTASKSSFFAKSRHDDMLDLPALRSSSSVHHTHHMTPSPPDESSSASSVGLDDLNQKSSISPFLSSSAPKGGFDHEFLKRSKTGDFNTVTASVFDERSQQKPAGPRAQNAEKSTSKSPHPREEATTPSSKSSLRRKLSLTWKRGNSKSSLNAPNDLLDKQSADQQIKYDNMPPPRIPVSATVQNLSSAKQSSPKPQNTQPTGGYLESRRRKSSAASLGNYVSHDRTKSDTWGSKKESAPPTQVPSSTRNTSMVNKLLKPKSSSNGMRSSDPWTADLDKDDMVAEDEMRKMGSRRKETEIAAKTLDALRKRATRKERVGPHEAIRIAMLNIYERGEIVDYPDVYFCGTQNANKVVGDLHSDAPNFGYDDERGDYTIVPGDHLSFRYEVVDILGKGSFGQVVRCIDHKLGVLVAVKIIRNKKRFHQQALVEVNILQKLREWDPKNKHSMVSFTQHFYFRSHLCISTELLDMNLYEFIKAHAFRGFSVRLIRRFTKQILSSLNLLKQQKVIHCDLKPENILLRHPLHSEIKVIDFGSSCFETEKVYTYIQSRFYRSPEVILGMTYGMPIDMWSVGCILAELYTGVPIFPGENEQEQLACIMEVFGPPEKHLIEKSTRKKLFFDSMGKPRLTVSSKGRRRRPSSKTLQQVLKCDDEPFLDFLARCLRWDPDRRLKPEDAIRHEFITGHKMPAPMPRLPARDPSPVKRSNTITVPRPLPDPPTMGLKAGALRSGVSPHKPTSAVTRRASGATAATQASTNKRTSTGASGISGMATSGLPRAAARSASGKQDLAAASATVAMGRKA